MKATMLVRDLVKLIAKHGDLDVKMCISHRDGDLDGEVKCVDEILPNDCDNNPAAFEIYGEEQ